MQVDTSEIANQNQLRMELSPRNVNRSRDWMKVERWTTTAVLEDENGFRRIKGCRKFPALLAQLEKLSTKQTQVA